MLQMMISFPSETKKANIFQNRVSHNINLISLKFERWEKMAASAGIKKGRREKRA